MKLEHGQLAQDKITGFTGMVTGHSDYMTGCDQYLLQPPCKEKGLYPIAQWFDEGRLELIGNKMSKEDVKGDKNGADIQAMTK